MHRARADGSRYRRSLRPAARRDTTARARGLSAIRHDPIAAPRIAETIVATAVSADDLLDEAYLADVAVSGAQLTASDAPGFEILQSRLTNVDLSDSSIPRFLVTDVATIDCNLANARTREFSFRRISVARSKWTGIQLIDGTIADATFTDSRLDLAHIDRVTFTRVAFHGCVLREVDFTNVTFDQVRFIDCDLSRTTFERMRVTDSELRNCTLTGMRGLAHLKGIAMEWNDVLANAELLATELGIAIVS